MPVDFNQELRLAFLRAVNNAQSEEEARIQTYRDFWEGEQGIILTDRQKDYILTVGSPELTTRENFRKSIRGALPGSWGNICKRVTNIPKDRLSLDSDGIVPADADSIAYAEQVSEWWRLDGLDAKQKDVYEASLRDGAVAVIVDWNDDEDRPTFVPNLIRSAEEGLVRFHFDVDNNLIFASKQWTIVDTLNPDTSGSTRLTIYRPGLIDRFIGDDGFAGGWRPLAPAELGDEPNPQFWTTDRTQQGDPLGVPVIPFENPGGSELMDVIIIQELLNHNLGTMDIVIDTHAFPTIWTVDANLPIDTTTGLAQLPDFGPGTGINLNQGGSMGRLEAADIQKLFDGGVLTWLQILALIKGWPLHFLDRAQIPPSGTALRQAEGSLISQIKDKQVVFGAAWAKAFDQARKIQAMRGGDELIGTLKFNWDSPATVDPLLEAQAMQARFDALQLPMISRLREAGKSQDEIDQIIKDAQAGDEFGLVDFEPEVE